MHKKKRVMTRTKKSARRNNKCVKRRGSRHAWVKRTGDEWCIEQLNRLREQKELANEDLRRPQDVTVVVL